MQIVYESKTGFTKEYAEMLGEATGLPCVPRNRAARGEEVIYLGWLYARRIRGLKKAMQRFVVRAVLATGMSHPSDALMEAIRTDNALPADMPVFYARGGLNLARIKGMDRVMVNMAAKMAEQAAAPEGERTPDEAEMLDLFARGGSRVDRANLEPVIAWYAQQTKPE